MRTLLSATSLCLSLLFLTACSQPEAYDIENRPFSMEQMKGEWVVLNFWAPWCQSCHKEMAELNTLYQQYKEKGLNLYAVSIDPMPIDEQIRQRAKLGIKYPQLRTDPTEKLQLPPIQGVPTLAIFTPEGTLLPYEAGGKVAKKLESIIMNQTKG